MANHTPNPVTGCYISVMFRLREENPLKLGVYRVDGGYIRTMAEGNYGSGFYQAASNTRDMPNGVHFYGQQKVRKRITRMFYIKR